MEKKYIEFYRIKNMIEKLYGKLTGNTEDSDKDNYLEQMIKRYEEKICNIEIYEKKWEYLCQKYEKIEIYGIEWVSIGETFIRLYQLVWDMQKKTSDNKLKVILPIFFSDYNGKSLFNLKIFDIFDRYLYFINNENIGLWKYIFKYHKDSISTTQFNKYYLRRGECILLDDTMPFIDFPEDKIVEAQKKMRQMGIEGEYICLHARDGKTKEMDFSIERARQTSARECDINSFRKASIYLQENNLQSVRMGKYERQQCIIPNVIDYANCYQDDYMDFYLIAHCRFMLGCDSGLTDIASYWRVPLLMTNMMVISAGYEGEVYLKDSMYLPKKIWSEKKGRYLSLWERFQIEYKYDISECNLEDLNLGLVVVNNTEEEIYQAAMEMYARLTGTWSESEEETKTNSKYWEIMNKWKAKHPNIPRYRRAGIKEYSMCPLKISWNFLKNNMYLLEQDMID